MTGRVKGLEQYRSGGRAFELDFLRGFAIFMMIVHHTAFDLRFFFAVPGLEFEGSFWVDSILRPVFLMIFLGVSGISSTFSKDNVRRGLRLFFVALLLTAVLFFINAYIIRGFGVIYFNVLQVIAWSTLLYAFLTQDEQGEEADAKEDGILAKNDALILVLAGIFIFYGMTLPQVKELQVLRSWWLLPFGFAPEGIIQLDYMPFIPWSGYYLLGAVIGRRIYPERRTRFASVSDRVLKGLSPFLWLGRHALSVYLLHQPLIYGFLTIIDRLLPVFPKP
jgi:uncharacterized membrane protein